LSNEISFLNAHPNAQRLMKDEFFYDITDQLSPFGDDDSWETFMAFQEWLQTNSNRNKMEFIHQQISYWDYPPFDLNTTDFDVINRYLQTSPLHNRFLYGTDEAIIATAFGQLYLEGLIDLNIRNLAITAIKRQTLTEMIAMHSEEFSNKIVIKYSKLLKVLQPQP